MAAAKLLGITGDSDREGGLEPLPIAGGPRARISANPGLNRAASLLVAIVAFCSSSAGALVCLESVSSLVGSAAAVAFAFKAPVEAEWKTEASELVLLMLFKLRWRASASGVACLALSELDVSVV